MEHLNLKTPRAVRHNIKCLHYAEHYISRDLDTPCRWNNTVKGYVTFREMRVLWVF